MAESTSESSDSTSKESSKVKGSTASSPSPAPPPAFKPSRATDNDTYFDRYFKPLNGDIILCHQLEYEIGPNDTKAKKKKKTKKKNKEEEAVPPLLARQAVKLYSDEFDQSQLHPGDYILRRGMFELGRAPDADGGQQQITDEWCWKDLESATLHVYWPNYHSRGDWFLVAKFPLKYCLEPMIDPDAHRKPRDFKEDPNFEESSGDIILRRLRIQDPTRPWGWSFTVWQLQDYLDEKELRPGDILVHSCGHYFPEFQGRTEEREPAFKLREALFRIEADCAWRDPASKKWFYGGQDVHCYKVKVTEPWITHERFRSVPKPGDILITQGQNLLRRISPRDCTGGYVQVYNEKRFFYRGDPPLSIVNVKGTGNMAIRFGHFDQHWDWTPLPTLQLFHFHEKEGAWYTLGPVVLTYKWMVAPDYSFELNPIELNSVVADFVPRKGDIVIRKPLPPPPKQKNPLIYKPAIRTTAYFEERPVEPRPDPFWKRIMKIVPYDAAAIRKFPLVPGDCLLRAGIEPAGPRSTAKYNAAAELYMLVLDHWDRLVWIFRGRDKVFFGGPEIEPRHREEPEEGEKPRPRPEEVLPKREIGMPSSEPRLVPSKLRRPFGINRKAGDILLERSIWNTSGPILASPKEFRALLSLDDDLDETESVGNSIDPGPKIVSPQEPKAVQSVEAIDRDETEIDWNEPGPKLVSPKVFRALLSLEGSKPKPKPK